MKYKKQIKVSLSILATFAILSCNIKLNDLETTTSVQTNSYSKSKLLVGKVDFPVNKSFKIQAEEYQVSNRATIALIYPPDDSEFPNRTVATGLSDINGNFSVSPIFSPIKDKIYILEASKRVESLSSPIISLRTYVKWTGLEWISITAPLININSKTTAIAIIDYYNDSIKSNDTIGSINNGAISNIKNIDVLLINNLINIVDSVLKNEQDPARFISYKNNKYFIAKEISVNKNYLISDKSCPNCNLYAEDITNRDLSNADLTNSVLTGTNLSETKLSGADLSNADLTNSNLINSNLINTNLTNTDLTSAKLTGARWINGTTICQEDSIGVCLFPDFLVNSYTTGNQQNSNIVSNTKGDFVITWNGAGNGDDSGIYTQRYNSSGVPQGLEFRINTYITNSQQNPSVAMDSSGNFIIAWQSYGQDGSNNGIYARRYNSSGVPQGPEFRVNTYITNSQQNPSVTMDSSGNFIIAWQSYGQDRSNNGIYAQRYNSSGVSQGPEFKVNSYTSSNQNNPSIAVGNLGSFIVIWQSSNQANNTSDFDIYAQRYSSSGIPQGSEFKVNTYTTNSQQNPSISAELLGNFIITWQSIGQDNNSTGIYAQRYSSSGISQGSEFKVNTYTSVNKYNSSVAMDSSGSFVIVWQSQSQEGLGSGYGLYTQRYSSSGIPQGSEFKVNTYTTNNQMNSSISMNNNGDFIIVWNGAGNNDADGIYMQRYDSNGKPK